MVEPHEVHVGGAAGDHPGHPVEDVDGPPEGDAGPERHEGVHVRRAVEQGFEAGDKERPVDDHHRQGEQHLCQRKAEMIVHQKSRQRPVQHVVAHRDIHQKDQKSDGQLEPAHQLRRLRVLERFLLSRQSG